MKKMTFLPSWIVDHGFPEYGQKKEDFFGVLNQI